MEILLVCAFTIFVTYDLINSWEGLMQTKGKIFLFVGFIATILLFVYFVFDVVPFIRITDFQKSFRRWYDLGYTLLTTYSVYDFVIWMMLSFSKARGGSPLTEPVKYGFKHAGFLLIGTCAACYLTILGNYYLFPPVGVSLIDIYWILIYFIFFIIVMIRMIWGETVNFRRLVRVVFSCWMGLNLLFFIMSIIGKLISVT